MKATQSVPAVEKVFAILEALAQSHTGLSLRELAQLCGVPKSTVHCIIVTLQRGGYLHRNQRTNRYLFGRKLFSLANHACGGLELRDVAEPHLRNLARRLKLPIHLGINERDEAVIVSKVDYPMLGSRVGSWIGKRMELHCTGLGKALISEWSEDELTRLVRHRTLSRHNDNTIWTPAKLQRDLAQARLNGYAIDDEEDVLGFRCVGVPVHDETGAVVAALSASGTVSEITADNVRTIGSALGAASRELSLALLPQPAGLADLSDVRQVC